MTGRGKEKLLGIFIGLKQDENHSVTIIETQNDSLL